MLFNDHLNIGEDKQRIGFIQLIEQVLNEKEKRRLDSKCWKGYRKSGTKLKGNVRVNKCVRYKK